MGTAYASVIPDYAKDKTIKYSSSKEDVATIDKNGKIKAKKAGKTTIKATSGNGKNAASKTLTVVKQVEADSVKIKEGDISVAVGKTKTLTVEVLPNNTVNKEVTWSSDKTDIATVDKNGKVKGIKAGTAKITAKTSNGKKDTIKVTVLEKETGDGNQAKDTSSRHKIGNALVVMRADELYCAYGKLSYSSSKSPTLSDTVKVAKQYGAEKVLDHVGRRQC